MQLLMCLWTIWFDRSPSEKCCKDSHIQANVMKVILPFFVELRYDDGNLYSIIPKLDAKSQVWIFSKVNPDLSKNKIRILKFDKPKSYFEHARALMKCQVCDNDPERSAGIIHAVDWRILPALLLCSYGGQRCIRAVHLHPSPGPLESSVKVLCIGSLYVTMRKHHSPSSSGENKA